jgi:hypothetical protein
MELLFHIKSVVSNAFLCRLKAGQTNFRFIFPAPSQNLATIILTNPKPSLHLVAFLNPKLNTLFTYTDPEPDIDILASNPVSIISIKMCQKK